MDVQITRKNDYTLEMTVTVPWSELLGSFQEMISRFGHRVRLPGFRKGKVPRKILMRQYGPEIEADFAQKAAEDYYDKAVRQEEIFPVNQAVIHRMEFREGEPLQFTAAFEVEPEVVLPDYRKRMKVKRNVYIPDEEDVDLFLEELRRQYAQLKTIETGSQEGHLLLVDMQELDRTGIPIIGRKVEDRYVQVGDGIFGGDNLDHLTGLKPGDKAVISIPGRGSDDPVKYDITVKNVQEEVLPELTEEFIRKVDESATNESELRERVLERIQARLSRDSDAQLNEAIIDYFVQRTDMEVPPSMVERYVDRAMEEARSRDGEKLDEDRFRHEVRPRAIRNLKWYLIRKALLGVEELEVSDEELARKIDQLAEVSPGDEAGIRRFYRKLSHRDRLRNDLTDEKLFAVLTSCGKIDEVKVTTKDVRHQRALSTSQIG